MSAKALALIWLKHIGRFARKGSLVAVWSVCVCVPAVGNLS